MGWGEGWRGVNRGGYRKESGQRLGDNHYPQGINMPAAGPPATGNTSKEVTSPARCHHYYSLHHRRCISLATLLSTALLYVLLPRPHLHASQGAATEAMPAHCHDAAAAIHTYKAGAQHHQYQRVQLPHAASRQGATAAASNAQLQHGLLPPLALSRLLSVQQVHTAPRAVSRQQHKWRTQQQQHTHLAYTQGSASPPAVVAVALCL